MFEDHDMFMQPYRSMLPAMQGGIVPPVDMYQTQTSLVIETPLAGVDPEKVEVSVDNGMLTIRGSMERKTEVEEQNYYRKEVRSGSVFRQIPLPIDVQEGAADATLENGMLRIDLPKKQADTTKTIKIPVKKKK